MKDGIKTILSLIAMVGTICFADIRRCYSQDDNAELIQNTVKETKAMLPIKIDAMTTFTDIIGGQNSLTYLYEGDMDLSKVPPDQLAAMKQKFPQVVCPKMTALICGVGKVFFERGITVHIKYYVKGGTTLAVCSYSQADCAN